MYMAETKPKNENRIIINNDDVVKTTYHVPDYSPNHILSPEFEGKSNYEMGIQDLIIDSNEKLKNLTHTKSSSSEIHHLVEDLKTLNCLYENYYVGMNVFRTAKGGRDKLRV